MKKTSKGPRKRMATRGPIELELRPSHKGFVYVVAIDPMLPGRVKIGWSTKPLARVGSYWTSSPNAELVMLVSVPDRVYEIAALSAAEHVGTKVRSEVFQVSSLPRLLKAIQAVLP